MESLTAHLPPGLVLDAEGNAPWPHPTILAVDHDEESGRNGLYKAILGLSGREKQSWSAYLPFTRPGGDGGLLAGFTNEALLAIVLHRLEGFQGGSGACDENAVASEHVEIALEALHERSARINVEQTAQNAGEGFLTRVNEGVSGADERPVGEPYKTGPLESGRSGGAA